MLVFRQYVDLAKVKRVSKMIHRRMHRKSRLTFTFTELTSEEYYRAIFHDRRTSVDGRVRPNDIFLMEIHRDD